MMPYSHFRQAQPNCTRCPNQLQPCLSSVCPPPDAGSIFGKHLLSLLRTCVGKARKLIGPISSSAFLRYYCFVYIGVDLAGYWGLLIKVFQFFCASCLARITSCKALYYYRPLSIMDVWIRICGSMRARATYQPRNHAFNLSLWAWGIVLIMMC